MSHKFSVLCLSVGLLFLNVFAYQEDEYYCRNNKDYQICRRCLDFKKPCPKEAFDEKCSCHHIAIFDSVIGDFRGGANCNTEDEYAESYCFVDEDSKCDDLEVSSFASAKDNLWYPDASIYYSLEACEETAGPPVTGSEKMLEGVRITTDYLVDRETGKHLEIDFPFSEDYDYYAYQEIETGWEKCAQQCTARNKVKGICGAWSFDNLNGKCYLHSVDACCGQINKREKQPEFNSGYVCPHCWSTRNECPCTLDIRQHCETCSAHSSAAVGAKPIHTTSAGVLEVVETDVNTDVCACKRKFLRRKKQWGCIKPFCDETANGTGCKDTRRCRKPRKKQS